MVGMLRGWATAGFTGNRSTAGQCRSEPRARRRSRATAQWWMTTKTDPHSALRGQRASSKVFLQKFSQTLDIPKDRPYNILQHRAARPPG